MSPLSATHADNSLRRQAEEESTVTGVLADLREAGVAVSVHTRTGGHYRGAVRALGTDFVALAAAATGQDVVVALAALSTVRTGPGVREASSSFSVPRRLEIDCPL